jgi:hypothetical protein
MSVIEATAIEATATLPPQQMQMLQDAVRRLEHRGFVAELAEYAGQPVARVMQLLPKFASTGLRKTVETTILGCLKAAIRSIKPGARQHPGRVHASSMLVGLSGGISGFFGLPALPIELPITTTLMLRGIADIAQQSGEDLSTVKGRLACLEVFALGAPGGDGQHVGYYASRVFLGRLTGDMASLLLERGLANLSTTAVGRLVTEIATRFGIVVTERMAASAMPVLGAVGGAGVNMLFMNHFQSIAQGHFTIRQLEREYGAAIVRRLYEEIAAQYRDAWSARSAAPRG